MSELSFIQQPIKHEMLMFKEHFKVNTKSKIQILDIISNYILYKKHEKQLRPTLVFLSAKLSGEINDNTYTAASLIELLHTAILIHDDVIDNSFTKRGIFSLNLLWKSKISVLMGDYFLAKGLLLAVKKKSYILLDIISQAVKRISEGGLLEAQKSRNLTINKEEYFEIVEQTTALIISACTAAGSNSTGADTKKQENLKEFGKNLGIALHINDDIRKYESLKSTAKSNKDSLERIKLSLPLIKSLEIATRTESTQIVKYLNSNWGKENFSKILTFVEIKGGIELSLQTMDEYKNKALDQLSEIPSTPAKEAMIRLVHHTISSRN